MKNKPQKKCEHIWNRAVTVGFKDRICGLCGAIEPMPTSTESTTKYANGLLYSSPTQPDTESWEEDVKMEWADEHYRVKELPDFKWWMKQLHQVSEKAYQRGLKENCIAIDKANMGWLKGLAPETSDFLKSFVEQGRQSAYREIEAWAYNNGITDKKSFTALIKFLKEKLNENSQT